MGRPVVTVYNEISVDGRIEGFVGDGVAYYRHGFTWPCDAILMGSVTAQAFGPPETDDQLRGDGPAVPDQPVPPGFEHLVGDPRHLLAVVDSRGTVRGWRQARAQPWYDRFVALTSATTPPAYLDHCPVARSRWSGPGTTASTSARRWASCTTGSASGTSAPTAAGR